MRIYSEISLCDFKFWSGAVDRAKYVKYREFSIIEENLEFCLGSEISDTAINDFFWFDFDTIAEWLGYKDEEDFFRRRSISPDGEIIEIDEEDEENEDEED